MGIVLGIILALAFYSLVSPNIHTATQKELMEINGIGEKLSTEILTYVNNNPECTVSDLDNVMYIGETRLKELERRWD